MKRSEVEAITARVRYKNWEIRVDQSGDIEIAANVKDAYPPYRRLRGANRPHSYVVDPQTARTESALTGRIFDACQRLEFHEATEAFLYKGKRIYDTHD